MPSQELYMETVHQGLRENALKKDAYERLICTECEIEVERAKGYPVGKKVYQCPECGTKWERM